MASGVVPEIETERLLLRGPAPADVDAWAACVADPEFGRFQPERNLTPHERAERKLTIYQRGWERQPVPYMGWVITTKVDGRLIGAMIGDPTFATLEWPSPTVAIYALRRDQFVPGDAY